MITSTPAIRAEARRLVGRCAHCRTPLQAEVTVQTQQWGTGGTARFILYPGGRRQQVPPFRGVFEVLRPLCPHCGEHVSLLPIAAHTAPTVRCGARCTEATGPVCSCECGGRNHGAALLVAS